LAPPGRAGIRVSRISGTLPETLYPGLHLVSPLVQHLETYDVRDRIFQTTLVSDPKRDDSLKVQTITRCAFLQCIGDRTSLTSQTYSQAGI
jgi:hypothetical protein